MTAKKPKTASAPEHARAVITCQIQKKPDGSLSFISVDTLPALERGDLLYIDLPAAGCEAPWKKDMLAAEAAMLAQENRKRSAAGLPPLGSATPEATDKELSKMVAALQKQVAALTKLTQQSLDAGKTAKPADNTLADDKSEPASADADADDDN